MKKCAKTTTNFIDPTTEVNKIEMAIMEELQRKRMSRTIDDAINEVASRPVFPTPDEMECERRERERKADDEEDIMRRHGGVFPESHYIKDVTLLVRAIDFAAVKHSTQRRKNKEASPYIEHPIRVMKILAECGIADIKTLIAGVLHDTVEDTKTTSHEISVHFGEEISKIVMEVTDDKSLPKVERKKEQIRHASSGEMSEEAVSVKLADKLANLQDITTDPPVKWSKEVVDGYVIWCQEVCEPMFGSNPLNCHLDSKLKLFFADRGVSSLTREERNIALETYYETLKPSSKGEVTQYVYPLKFYHRHLGNSSE